MKKITESDLRELRKEILSCFLHIAESKLGNKLNGTEQQLVLLIGDVKNRSINGFQISVLYQILEELNNYLLIFNDLPQVVLNKQYQQILNNYIEFGYHLYGFDNKKLKNRINGLKNIKKRYEKNLYEKRQIIYRVLRETALQRGKWSTLNQAVREVYPILEVEFNKFDEQWIKNRMKELKKQIKQNELALKDNKKPSCDESQINYQNRTYVNKIDKCKSEYEKLVKALKAKNIGDVMGKTLAFNSDYQEETIINHLRDCPDVLIEVLK
ncbi:hypothetical protein [Acinetobacter bereziniae]|uniref:hypothetical protein n=2 Tax=Acinetobacter bereziniae TaxID=106648 RepID=UPI00124FB341|nr:hypothetical protein [Acinetobacter bereziniae]